MPTTSQQPARLRRPRAATPLGATDLKRFWPSRRGHAFDELCR